MLTFFVPSRRHWRVSKQDGGGLVVLLMDCQLSPYAWVSLDIWHSSRDPMGAGSTLADLMNSASGGKP